MRKGLDHLRDVGSDEGFQLHDFMRKDFRWNPRPTEQGVIEQIEGSVGRFIQEQFDYADKALEHFYRQVRVVETTWVSGIEAPQTDENDNVVYRRDEFGDYEEDWTQLTGQDAEELIFRLQRVISTIGEQVTRLYMRAQFAYNVWDDEYWEAYRKPIDGTQNDRIAIARRETRDSRYFYMYQYWYWKSVHDKLQNVEKVKKDVERFVERRLRDRGTMYG
jgi:hypothetical protein